MPVNRKTFLGPKRSSAIPPRIANILQRSIYAEKIPEVAPRESKKSASIDLKKMPKEARIPREKDKITMRAININHP